MIHSDIINTDECLVIDTPYTIFIIKDHSLKDGIQVCKKLEMKFETDFNQLYTSLICSLHNQEDHLDDHCIT